MDFMGTPGGNKEEGRRREKQKRVMRNETKVSIYQRARIANGVLELH
jgi:hypothetical protein